MADESDSESSAALDFFDGNSIVGRNFVSMTFDDPGYSLKASILRSKNERHPKECHV